MYRISYFLLILLLSLPEKTHSQINNSFISFTVNEKDLLPESIAYDPVKENFFMGSTRKGKIVKVSKDGNVSDFINSKQDGLWMVVGMKADIKRRVLWICSTGGDNLVGYNLKDDVEGRPAGIFKFNLDTGKLIKKYLLNDKGGIHFLNDIIVARNGDVYITHMFKEHSIYKISNAKNTLEKVFSPKALKYPNGIAISDSNTRLYIAHAEGILLINLKDSSVKPVEIPEGLKIKYRESIDGLYYYKNTLIGVQSDIKTVQQFTLNSDGTKIIKSKLLEVNHPIMNHPTTGEIVDGHFYYVANAQFESFNKDGSLYPKEKLYEPVVLKIKLK